MRDLLPDQVMNQIQSHLRESCKLAESGFTNNQKYEERVTGALCERLRTTPNTKNELKVDGQVWNWRISHGDIRGNGPDAAEKKIGADGIFQIEFRNNETGVIFNKGMLFQAKMENKTDRAKLFAEMENMERITPDESIVVVYSPNGYKAIRSNKVLSNTLIPTTRVLREESERLEDLLADQFLECLVGVWGLFYDETLERIYVPAEKDIKERKFPINHSITIDISSGQVERVRS